MIKQAKILLLLLCPVMGPLTRVAIPQESITVSRAAWVKAAGNDIYDAGAKGSPQILRWRDKSMSAITPFRPSPGEGLQLLATYGTLSGDYYVCYSKAPRGFPPRAFIGKLDFHSNSLIQIWADDQLYPRSIAIGPTGYIYVLGMTRKQETELFLSMKEGESIQVSLLHIFTREGQEVGSMIPVSIAALNGETALSVLRRSTISFRKNGNFFLQFNPFTTGHPGWESLSDTDVLEYSPAGQIVNTSRIATAPKGSVIAALVVDTDDSLIVQFVGFSTGQQNKEGITTFGWNESKTYRVSSGGGNPEEIMRTLARHEIITGILANGKIMTELLGRNVVQVWSR